MVGRGYTGSFGKVLNGDNGTGGDLPEGLVQRLLDRFASKEGYALYEDAGEFMVRMREVKRVFCISRDSGHLRGYLSGLFRTRMTACQVS